MSSSFLYNHAKEYLQLKQQFWTGWVYNSNATNYDTLYLTPFITKYIIKHQSFDPYDMSVEDYYAVVEIAHRD